MPRLLILGAGYTGRFMKNWMSIHQPDWQVIETSRTPSSEQVAFDLMDEATWRNLPHCERTLWTFPAKAETLPLENLGRVVVMGSTGSYVEGQDPVSEDSQLDTSLERVLGEEWLQNQRATVVRASGIYGPGRNPLNWVEQGRVSKSSKLVNFIHVEDLVRILWLSFEDRFRGEALIASDGNPFSWEELIGFWQTKYDLKVPSVAKSSRRPSRRVDAEQSLQRLGVQLKYQSVKEWAPPKESKD